MLNGEGVGTLRLEDKSAHDHNFWLHSIGSTRQCSKERKRNRKYKDWRGRDKIVFTISTQKNQQTQQNIKTHEVQQGCWFQNKLLKI